MTPDSSTSTTQKQPQQQQEQEEEMDRILQLANDAMRQGQQILLYQQQQQHQQLQLQNAPVPGSFEQAENGGGGGDALEYFHYAHSLLGNVVFAQQKHQVGTGSSTGSSGSADGSSKVAGDGGGHSGSGGSGSGDGGGSATAAAAVTEQSQPKDQQQLQQKDNENNELLLMTTLAFAEVCRVIAGVYIKGHSQYNHALPYLQQSHQALLNVLGPNDERTIAMANDVDTVQYILSSVLLYNNDAGGKPQQQQIRRASSASTSSLTKGGGEGSQQILVGTASSSEQENDESENNEEEEQEQQQGILLHWFERDDYDDTNREPPLPLQQPEPQVEEEENSSKNKKPLGISIDWIKRGFWKQLKHCNENWNPFHTVQQLLDSGVIPYLLVGVGSEYGSSNSSYVDRLLFDSKDDKQDSQQQKPPANCTVVGPASLLISYSNETTIGDIINSLDDYCRTNHLDDRTVYVWMEFLCQKVQTPALTQSIESSTEKKKEKEQETTATTPGNDPPHQEEGGCKDDDEEEELLLQKERIEQIGHVLAILQPWYQPSLWERPKCLQEIMLAAASAAASQKPQGGGSGCKLTLVLPPEQIVALSDTLVGNPSTQINQLYKSLDESLTLDQQRIFRPWVRNVIHTQVKEHCKNIGESGDNDNDNGNGDDNNNGKTKEQKQRQQAALNVFQLQLCNKMGLLFWQYGEYKTSLELLEDALGLSEAMYGQNHESTATVYQNIANVLSDMGRYDLAIETYTTALQILSTITESPPPPSQPPSQPTTFATATPQHHRHHPRIAGLCSKLGNLYRITSRLDKAMEYHQRALAIHQQEGKLLKQHDNNDNDDGGGGTAAAVQQQQQSYHLTAVADCYKDMGNVFFSKGDNDAALMEFRKALKIQQQQHSVSSSSTQDDTVPKISTTSTTSSSNPTALAATLNQIGLVLKTKGDFDGALQEFRLALSIQEEAFGRDHIQTTITSYSNIISVMQCQDNYEGALEIAKKALDIYHSYLGPNHPTTAAGWYTLGCIQNELDQVEDALESYRQALQIRQQSSPSSSSSSSSSSVLLLGGSSSMEQQQQRHHHPVAVAETLQSIGTLLFEIGDLDEALVELRKAFDIVEPILGIEHPTTKGIEDAINTVLEA